MVKTWETSNENDFQCPSCGALYAVTVTRYPLKDKDSANCEVCGQVLREWNDTRVPTFTLKSQLGKGA